MNKRDKEQLAEAIDASVAAHNAVHKAVRALDKLCEKHWDFAPSDRGIDEIIDSVYGGCGYSLGMPVEEFIKYMEDEARKELK